MIHFAGCKRPGFTVSLPSHRGPNVSHLTSHLAAADFSPVPVPRDDPPLSAIRRGGAAELAGRAR